MSIRTRAADGRLYVWLSLCYNFFGVAKLKHYSIYNTREQKKISEHNQPSVFAHSWVFLLLYLSGQQVQYYEQSKYGIQ